MAVITKFILMYRIQDQETLLINSLNSAMDIIDDAARAKIENMQQGIKDIDPSEDTELYNQLMKRGYLFENKQIEDQTITKYRHMYEEIRRRRVNNTFTICPTMGCNLRCTYCFESDDNHVNFDVMTDSQLDTIFAFISEKLVEINAKQSENSMMAPIPPSIAIFGGEPLLKQNYEVIKRILEFADLNKLEVRIISNGTNISGYEEILSKYKDLIHFQITVDGDRDVHDSRRIRADGKGSFDSILNNIEQILNIGIRIGLRINVDKENLKVLKDLEATIKSYPWANHPLLMPVAAPVLDFCGKGKGILKENEFLEGLIQEGVYGRKDSFIKGLISATIGYLNIFFSTKSGIKPWKMDYCDATSGANLVFSPDGNVTTCLSFAGKGKHIIGSFNETGVHMDPVAESMWNHRSVFRIEKCLDCKFAFLCGGGCPVKSLETNHDIDNAVCSDIEKTLEKYIHYYKDAILNRQSGKVLEEAI